MSKRVLPILLAGLLVLTAVVLRTREATAPATPEKTVTAFFDAASRGDDARYLELLGGELAVSLRRLRSQQGSDAFRASLRRSSALIKGLAVTRRQDGAAAPVVLDIEIVYADRNERQTFHLEPNAGGWVITAMGSSAIRKPRIPYGTPVWEE